MILNIEKIVVPIYVQMKIVYSDILIHYTLNVKICQVFTLPQLIRNSVRVVIVNIIDGLMISSTRSKHRNVCLHKLQTLCT